MTREEQLSKLNEAQAKWTAAVKAEAERTAALATKPPGFNFTAENVVTANAEVTIEFYAIHGHLTAELTFDNGQKMKFDGRPWGIGAAAGKGVGWYYGVPAQILAGGCHYWCQFGGAVGGVIQITCWRDGYGALGQINAFAGIAGAGETGGDDGSWTNA